jgi:hypothetical protein
MTKQHWIQQHVNGIVEMRNIMFVYPDGTNARLIEVAAAEVGTIEEGDNLTKYGKFTKADGLPWCGSFVNWCAAQAGVKIQSSALQSAHINSKKFNAGQACHN